MNFGLGIIISIALLVLTFFVLAIKIAYPYQRRLGFGIFLFSWIPFLYSLSLRKQWLFEQQETVITFVQIYWIHFLFALILLLAFYVLNLLFPASQSFFAGLSRKEIDQVIKEDKQVIKYLHERIRADLKNVLAKNIFYKDFKSISSQERQTLKDFWVSFIAGLTELDVLKEKYKSFYQIDSSKMDLHDKAFCNGFAVFLAQHFFMVDLVEAVKDEKVEVFLNEKIRDRGVDSDTYDRLKVKMFDASEIIRLNAARAYYSFFKNKDFEIDTLIGQYLARLDNYVGVNLELIVKQPLRLLEKKSFQLWFPIQRSLARTLGYIRATKRRYLIRPKRIRRYRKNFQPGDIFLERREWHASNIGIPGYWTHSAMYMGTLEYLDKYFLGLPALKGKSFSDYLDKNNPQALLGLQKKDNSSCYPSLIEVKRQGVLLGSLEKSVRVDSLAVLRVRDLNKSERFQVLIKALEDLGKPYDFDFNFVTENKLVCSELIYRAYSGIDKLSLQLREFNGRLFMAPNQFVEKFAQEMKTKKQELDLVLFLDGNERKRTAKRKKEKEFSESWKRPKWHILKDYLKF